MNDLTGCNRHQSHNPLNKGALARTIAAYDAGILACLYLKRCMFYSDTLIIAVNDRHISDFQN